MRIFYSIEDKHLIVTPMRNGSTHLYGNMPQYRIIDATHLPIFNSVIAEAEKKTFIYRDPCIRLLSFYEKFIYRPYVSTKNMFQYTKQEKDLIAKFKPNTRGNNVLTDFILAKDNIEKNFETDPHTMLQYSFFKSTSLLSMPKCPYRIDDYEIISIEQYVKWIKLTFKEDIKHKNSPIHDINVTPENFGKMQKIQEFCRILYKEDYEFLEPRITFL